MKIAVALALVFIFCSGTTADPFNSFVSQFTKEYKTLEIPSLALSYVTNMEHIKPIESVNKQLAFFKRTDTQLQTFDTIKLDLLQKQDYAQIKYETRLNLERLSLEEKWLLSPNNTIIPTGLYNNPNGKAWYAYFLKKWISDDVTPDQIFQFGLNEVDRVSNHIEDIRKKLNMNETSFYNHLNDSTFFIHDPALVQQSFEHTYSVIVAHMGNVFSDHVIRPLAIKKGADQSLAQTPGYYDTNTFYYNLFDKPYNKRQVDWLFIHEAIPGHHYQSSRTAELEQGSLQDDFHYLGLSEGWAAYTEELGKQLGVYQTIYDELGKWEWDIVRSVRVPMDVGLNYYGWSDEQALVFWKKHIANQDDIAMREISRVKRWPVQCITYKYGASQILQWKEQLQKLQGNRFDIKDFHDRILNHGSLPIFLVRNNVLK